VVVHQEEVEIRTRGRGAVELTDEVRRIVRGARVETGLVHVFCRHTSASLLITENADPAVREDLETFLSDLVPDGDRRFVHVAEGPDDMPAHVRMALLGPSATIPVHQGRLALGTWQGIFLYEHRTAGHLRSVLVTVSGAAASTGRRSG